MTQQTAPDRRKRLTVSGAADSSEAASWCWPLLLRACCGRKRRIPKLLTIFCFGWAAAGARAAGGQTGPQVLAGKAPLILSGEIADPTGALIPDAAVSLLSGGVPRMEGRSDAQGRYEFRGGSPGSYTLRVSRPGFAVFASPEMTLDAGRPIRLDVKLEIEKNVASVSVAGSAVGSVDPTENVGQLRLRGSDLDAFSEDSEDLQNELQMLSGPSAGPNGPQIFIDGFTDGIMPPKQSIREIRINQNPFSAEFDRIGFGRVEIFTKPGTDQYHAQASFDFGNRALTARNPYLSGDIVPGYQQDAFAGSFSGPLSKRSSLFVDLQRRITDENAVLNYTQLDPDFNPESISSALSTPSHRFSFSPRLDFALSPNQTLVVRYSLAQSTAENQGISAQNLDLPTLAYGLSGLDHNLQVSESAVAGASILNTAQFQFYRTNVRQQGVSTAPEIQVQGSFTGGGSFPLNYTDRDRYEFQNHTTYVHGSHTVAFGLRWRDDVLSQQSTSNFNGEYIFSANVGGLPALLVYQQNQRLTAKGVSQAKIAAMGFGPSLFLLTTGQPSLRVSELDVNPYLQDDWRLRSSVTLSWGVRYEVQNRVADYENVAPRAAIAWAPTSHARSPFVLRAGAGIFYDRFTSDLIWNATRQNGAHQRQYLIRNPLFYPTIPDPSTLAALTAQDGSSTQTVYQIDPRLRVPRLFQSSVSVERALPGGASVSLTYSVTRGWHQLRTLDINAPMPTSSDAQGLADGPRPYGKAAGDIYQYSAKGVFRQQQLTLSGRMKVGRYVDLFGYYVYGRAMSDTDGPNTFPSNPYDLRAEYGRAAFDFRNRGFISSTFHLPLKIQISSFLFLQSGMPYNIVTGVDTNNDGNLGDDRPAFAQGLLRSSVVTKPGFGAFDISPLALPGAVVVPRNSLGGPGILSLTSRVSRTWSFGRPGRRSGVVGGDEIRGGDSIRSSSNQAGIAGVFGGTETHKPYNLTFSASFRNALNNVNPAIPIGNLSSPYFGRSLSLNTFGPLPGAGPSAGAGNRHIELQLKFAY